MTDSREMQEKYKRWMDFSCDLCKTEHEQMWDAWRGYGENVVCWCTCHTKYGVNHNAR